ncbi:MAG: glycosyltransferase family A protein [Verrucomicrobiota bacterium]
MEIAVIIPVFNRRAQLQHAVGSVLSQSVGAAEIIVVDDGSTQDLSEIREWCVAKGCQWVVRENNGGPGLSRNEGVEHSKSRWIAFLDSDDVWLTQKLEKQVEWHLSNPSSRISHVEEQWVRDGKKVSKSSHWRAKGGDLFEASCQRCSIGPSCVMIRRDLWDASGGFQPRFKVCEDFELWLRITSHESVGLVSGEGLVEKRGGHTDQLSLRVAAMDRYRIVALLRMLRRSDLTAIQEEIVVSAIRRKARIVSEGAFSRGLKRRSDLYRGLIERDLTGSSDGLNPVEAELWTELEAS